jgi:hypothetical protein
MIKKIFVTLGKLLFCAFAFYFGNILGGILSSAAGLPMPEMPAGSDAATIQTALMFASGLVAVCLALLSRRLAKNFVLRWLSMAALVWLAYGVNTYLEAKMFTTYASASIITIMMSLMAGLSSGAAAAWLFAPVVKSEPIRTNLAPFFRQFTRTGWVWRCLAAIAAFPAIYYFFGSLISPIVLPYYQQPGGSLVIPALGTLLPVLFLRSFIFLVSCFMILATWQDTRLSLFLILGATMFMLVGGIGMLLGSFLPAFLRMVHSVEILADSLSYVAVLTWLFRSGMVKLPVGTEKIELKAVG